MPKVTIDGQELEVPNGTTILQACQQAGVEIPHFCYHERLQIAGNCRMCLVEVERSPKPFASCAMPEADGNVIHTQSEKARKARHGVMEMLLINHPLDCPICDQGGECDLQDQAMAYGFDRGRFEENKRAVRDKDFGPLVATSMNRCIHCTRCIRFLTEIAGVEELGATGRGEAMEITTYIEKALGSELSGNIIDLCPVGALTSKPYSYVARPWELRKTESVDVLDAVGSNIRIDSRGAQILRVLPRLHEDINEEWISDKTRFAIDGLVRRRLDRPYIRRNGKLVEAEWQEALDLVADRLKGVPGERIAAIAGDLCDAEAMYALKELLTGLGATSFDCRQDGARLDPGCRAGYLFNPTIAGIGQVGGLGLGFVPGPGGRDVAGIMEACRSGAIEILYLLGADEIDLSDIGSAFVVYQGHHGDRGAARADVVLPGAAYTEKDATYVNTEGRVQLGRKAVFPPGRAREDWAILRALSGVLGRPLHFDSLSELRHHMRAAYPVFGEIDHIVPAEWGMFGEAGPVGPEPVTYPIADFYRPDPISRASATTAQCSERSGRRSDAAPPPGTPVEFPERL